MTRAALLAAPRHGPVRCLWPAAAQLGEGLCWSPSTQRLWWVDILGHTLYQCTASGEERRQWQLPDTVSAVAEAADGCGLVVTLRHGLFRFDPDTGRCTALAEPEGDRPDHRFNDGKCDALGRFWGGTMDVECSAPTGQLWCFEGVEARCAFAAGYPVTNGPTWIDAGRTLLFNDTVHRRVMAHAFDAESGAVGPADLWCEFSDADGFPDGITTDADGRVWIAHWGAGCVTAHDPRNAQELQRITLPTRNITNVTFGGPDFGTLFVTTARTGHDAALLDAEPLAGGLFAVDTNVRGVAAHRFRETL